MSRCFPFPPPGYETKPSSDHVNFLAKERGKEKKHKKKEKERGKREGKERKDKDKHKDRDYSKDRHREKKDKKDKHKDKKRKKSKDGDKENKRIFNEKARQGHMDGHNVEKLAGDGRVAGIHRDSIFTEESVKRIRDDANGVVSQAGKEINSEFKRNTYLPSERKGTMGGEMVHATHVPEQKNMVMAGAARRDTGGSMPHSTEQRRADGQAQSTDDRAKEERVEASKRASEHKIVDTKREENKDNDLEKSHKGKDRERDKERRREKGGGNHKEQDKSAGTGQGGDVEFHRTGSSIDAPVANRTGPGTNLKRKERNGFLHGMEVRPNKLPRPASSPVENGKTTDGNHIAAPSPSDRHEVANTTVEPAPRNEEQKIDDVISVCNGGDTVHRPAPPHPDEKYLAEILCLPVPETRASPEFGDDDGQEWLFRRDDTRPKRKTGVEKTNGTLPAQVWDKALHIGSPDVFFALPYVVPY